MRKTKSLNFLVTGSGGQLAKEFQKTFSAQGLKFEAPPEEELDIMNFQQAENVVNRVKPDVILNCAAYNSVDMAEKNPSVAHDVNHHAVKNLSSLCRKLDIFLVHYSTDYVFDGKKEDFYREEDRTNPLNEYGESKLKGEKAVRETMDDFLILRLSWVFGNGQSNFLCKLAKWAEGKRILKISADEVSVPTYTEDIVEVTLAALEKGMKGLYHLTNNGYCSRYELAKYFIKKMGMSNVLIPVSVSAFQTAAKRPSFSAMANDRISKELNVTIPEWEDSVDRFIKRFREELP